MSDFSQRIADLPPEKRRLLEARLAEKRASRAPAEIITPRKSVGPSPLSFPQQRLWFLDQLEPGSPFYNLPVALRLGGPINLAALERSLNEIVRRHEILRTTYRVTEGRPEQVVSPPEWTPLTRLDLTSLPEEEREHEATKLVSREAARPFTLSSGPLLRSLVVRVTKTDHILLLAMHHIVTDGWSINLLLSELAATYGALSHGKPPPLPELPIQFADFSAWQREWLQGETLESEVTYWKDTLAGAPFVLELPTDRPRPAVKSFRGAQHLQSIPERLTDRLRHLSRQEGATLFMTLLAAFYVLLFRYTRQRDILVGTPIAGRDREELEHLIGFFVNTLVLRGDLSGNPPFTELLGRIRETALGAYDHQSLPFERLVEEFKPERDASRTPLFQVMFALQNVGAREFQIPGVQVTSFRLEGTTARFDLFLSMTEGSGDLGGLWEYDTDLFDASRISRMAEHFETLLEEVASNPRRRISDLALLPEPERRLVLVEWNNTAADYPRDRCIQRLFEAQVERTPGHTAFTLGSEALTYEELNLRANRLAHDLQRLGIGPGSLVGIFVPRSWEMVVGLFATLKAGGAYVPLDPSYPSERIAYMLADARPAVLLTSRQAAAMLPEGTTGKVIYVEEQRPEGDGKSARNPVSTVAPDDPAYVIYTSGSTGKPKGVVGLHRGAVNRFHWMWTNYPFRPGEICCQKTSLSFVDSVWEIFGPSLAGVPTVLLREELVRDVPRLVETLAEERITRLVLVPALLRAILDHGSDLSDRLAHLNLWVSSGEALREELVERFYERLPAATLLNLYGSSEASADSTVFDTRGVRASPVPIGRPIANHRVFLLDDFGQPVPLGVSGEIHIAGEGIARGYWNRPELTAERFLPDPFAADAGGRLYRTGDLARFRPDGSLEFLGRDDEQVKIRGHRVELGEIEAALRAHESVGEAVVRALEENTDTTRLVAYVVARSDPPPSVTELRSFLKESLQDYMVPSAFVFLDALPLTPNGKIDRRALPAPGRTRPELESAPVAPRNAVEEALAEIWCEVLGLEGVGVRDDFFAIGGHSLLAVRLFSEIEKVIGRKLPLATLFQAPTIEELASILSRENWTAPWSPLVAIQTQGSKPPFFCVHPGGGQVLYYRDLARRLGPDQPFYGLQANLFGDYRGLLESVAGDYIKEIRTVQPEGPYFLGGLCAGGMIAFEMAQQLHAQGQSVALLALLDTYAPGYPKLRPNEKSFRYKVYRFFRRIHLEGSNLLLLERREKLAYILEKAKRVRKHTRQRIRAIAKKLSKAIRPMPIQHPLPADLQQVPEYSRRLVKRYVPGVYPGRATVFRASNQPIGYESDPHLGWGELVAGGVETYEVPGHHESIALEPRVAHLAMQLRQCLEKSRAVEKLDIDPVRAVGVGS